MSRVRALVAAPLAALLLGGCGPALPDMSSVPPLDRHAQGAFDRATLNAYGRMLLTRPGVACVKLTLSADSVPFGPYVLTRATVQTKGLDRAQRDALTLEVGAQLWRTQALATANIALAVGDVGATGPEEYSDLGLLLPGEPAARGPVTTVALSDALGPKPSRAPLAPSPPPDPGLPPCPATSPHPLPSAG